MHMPESSSRSLTRSSFAARAPKLSPSMGNFRTAELPDIDENGQSKVKEMTNLEWAMQFVLMKIQEMVRLRNL